MFGIHWSSASGDMKYLISPVTSQEYMIVGSCDPMIGSSSLCVTFLLSLVVIDNVEVQIYFFDLSPNLARLHDLEAPEYKLPPCQVWRP